MNGRANKNRHVGLALQALVRPLLSEEVSVVAMVRVVRTRICHSRGEQHFLSAPNRGCPPELARCRASQVLLQREVKSLHHSYQASPRPGRCYFAVLFPSGIAEVQARTDPLSASAPVACRSREAGGFSSGTAQRTPVRVRVSR